MRNEIRKIEYNTKSNWKWLSGLLLGLILGILTFAVIMNLNANADGLVIVTFLMNGFLSATMIIRSSKKRPYLLETIHWIFFFFFFFFAAIIQYGYSDFPWGLKPKEEELIKANLLLFAWGILFFLGGKARSSKNDEIIKDTSREKPFRVSPFVLNIFLIVSVMIAVYYLATVGLTNLLSRATNEASSAIESQTVNLLVDKFTQAFVLFTFVFCLLDSSKNQGRIAISLICLLICCFPTGVARNVMAIIYVGLMVLFFEKSLRGRSFTYIFLLGLIFVFPLLNAFRRSAIDEVQIFEMLKRILSEFLEAYREGDYDAYSMLIQTFRYTEKYGVEFGMQFIGVLFFFVPRTMWGSKPIGSGAMIMETLGRDFTNVSCPFFAECWINFGGIGLLLGAFMTGYFIRRLDNAYWKRELLRREKRYAYIDIIYPFLLSAFFFMMRGDLMSSFSYTFSYVFVSYLMYFIAIKKGRLSFKRRKL